MTLIPLLRRPLRALAVVASLGGLAACDVTPVPEDILPAAMPVMGWDHRPEAEHWTEATLAALLEADAPLVNVVPDDITDWCPGYVAATADERAAFWAGLFSALARFESTWNPQAVGGGGQWFGLVQISPRTARSYGCDAASGDALQDGAANLSCAVQIAERTVARDRVVAAGGGGLAADWGPFANAGKRAEMASWVSSQSYCSAPPQG
ncbi:MAG: transglycosylase SLT domain-containing protein [Rhodobacterales bacterium]|nr:transglycosylase SLT domain-containing protein [Rhodobacterales bacterium]